MSAVLQLSGICKAFGGLKVIDDVSFDVPEGSRTALIGPNGAGKSTVFNLVSGVYPLDQGRITALGQDITTTTAAAAVAATTAAGAHQRSQSRGDSPRPAARSTRGARSSAWTLRAIRAQRRSSRGSGLIDANTSRSASTRESCARHAAHRST